MASRYSAKVVKIFDGDTIEVELKKNNKKTIRFFGIDCPERTQEYGPLARSRVQELLKDKTVEVFTIELGKYGREVGIVYIDGVSIAEVLLKDGLAFASGNNHKLASTYHRLQERSRANKIGMWKLGSVENPANFRKRKRYSAFKVHTKLKPAPEDFKSSTNDSDKGIIQKLKDFIGEKIKDFTEKEADTKLNNEYISADKLLEKMNKKQNKPKV
ncbi:MAG: thermonuclease family protein [Silvanigrellaceae bacterium]|nr:thermonuclease family protein [Silvanigrellaceae bacterium]